MFKIASIPGYVHFGVVQERDDDHVGGEYENRHQVVDDDINPTRHLRPQVQQVHHHSHGNQGTHTTKQVSLECLVLDIEVIDLK